MGASHSKNPGAFPAPAGVAGGGGSLKDKDSLWAPFSHPHTLTQWAQVWDGNSSNKLGHPLSLGRAPGEGAGERAEEALPTSHWAAVYTQAMSWLLAALPAAWPGAPGEAGGLLPGSSGHSVLGPCWLWAPEGTAGDRGLWTPAQNQASDFQLCLISLLGPQQPLWAREDRARRRLVTSLFLKK